MWIFLSQMFIKPYVFEKCLAKFKTFPFGLCLSLLCLNFKGYRYAIVVYTTNRLTDYLFIIFFFLVDFDRLMYYSILL